MKKYTYYKVIQQNYGQGWEDVSFYETNSQFAPIEYTKTLLNGRYLSLLSCDLKEYKIMGYDTRTINRKELN